MNKREAKEKKRNERVGLDMDREVLAASWTSIMVALGNSVTERDVERVRVQGPPPGFSYLPRKSRESAGWWHPRVGSGPSELE